MSVCSSFSSRLRKQRVLAFFALVGLFVFSGCETVKNYRMHPEFAARNLSEGNRVLGPIDIKISEVSAGGVSEEMDEYSEEAERMFAIQFAEVGEKDRGSWKMIQVSEERKADFEEAIALARTVFGSAMVYSYYGTYPGFKHKQGNFRYSIGDMSEFFGDSNADAMLLVFGADQYTTAGRKALNGMLTVLSAAATGYAYIGMDGMGGVFAVLVDREGEILWMTHHINPSMDLRKEKDVDQAVDVLLADLARATEDSKVVAK